MWNAIHNQEVGGHGSEIIASCQGEWQQRADPNLLSQDSQKKKKEANVSLENQSNAPQMPFFVSVKL